MSMLDWLIVAGVFAAITSMVFVGNRYTRSVADFLVSGRSAGRYLLAISRGMIWIGAVNVIMMFELYMDAGLNAMWWEAVWALSGVYAAITGFGAYRFRQTRALTLAQFLEMRYGRAVRVISGVLSWVTGLISFGFFPGVGSRFFIYFCDLPQAFQCLGHTFSTFGVLMFVLIAISFFFVTFGGHIALLLTDFVQGAYTHVVSVIITVFLLVTVFDWGQIIEVLQLAPADQSQINPAKTSGISEFNIWFFAVGLLARWYNVMSFSAEQTYVSAATSAHEGRMAATIHYVRWFAMTVFFMVIVLVCKVYLQHPDYAESGAAIHQRLAQVAVIEGASFNDPHLAATTGDSVAKQQTVSVALAEILPVGMKGLFCAMMLACLISTYDTIMHTLAAVFIQDVIMPFRTKPLSPRAHIRLLRWSIVAVAVFMFALSYLVTPTGSLLMFFALVNNLWLGCSGAIILGGLYWKRGSNAAALATLILGTVMSAVFIAITLFHPEMTRTKYTNGQMLFFYTIATSTLCYVLVSLVGSTRFNLNKMLHRGRYDVGDGHHIEHDTQSLMRRLFGITGEYTAFDRFTAYVVVGWAQFWAVVVIVGTIYANTVEVSDACWGRYWYLYLGHGLVLLVVVTAWIVLGGFRDMVKMLRHLAATKRDEADDGMVYRNEDH